MEQQWKTKPISLQKVQVTDTFWHSYMELVRQKVIPYQWEALNDRVPGAAPSWCMHNFRAAARLQARKKSGEQGPAYTFRGFEVLPKKGEQPREDQFYGFVFQDSDFSKWIEAVGYSLTQHPDPALEATADEAIECVCAAQADDGYLDTYYLLSGMDRAFTYVKDHHELYCLGHLVEGAVAYYQATGKDKLLKAACRFADCVAARFGRKEGQLRGYPGHEIAEMALVRLYEATGEEKYLTLSKYFVDERGQSPNFFVQEQEKRSKMDGTPLAEVDLTKLQYYQAHQPVLGQEEAVGHAVRAMYLYSGMADVARETGDDALFVACKRLWHSAVEEKRYITGGVGGTRHGEAFSYSYHLPNDTAYSETCAAVGLVFFARRMLQIDPDSRYGDVMEQALYNTVLAGMAQDGKSFFYVNPLEVVPEACRKDEDLQHVQTVRQPWFGCACCPPNIARLVSSVASYAYTQREDCLLTHLYMSGTVEVPLHGRPLKLAVDARLMEEGKVTVRVLEGQAEGTLGYRLPGWSKSPCAMSAGKEKTIRNGYVYFTGVWQAGDTVTLEFPLQVRVLKAHQNVRENAGKVAFTYGPWTYCAEEADNGADLHRIRIHPERLGVHFEQVQVKHQPVCGRETVVLEVPAYREVSGDEALYSEWQSSEESAVTLTLIPYFLWANRGEGEMRVWLRE